MKRVTIEIDFLGISMEVAQVRPTVTVGQLIQDVLVQFGLTYPFLNQHQPQNYVLRTAVNGIDLPHDQPVQQVGGRGVLFFQEKVVDMPKTLFPSPTGNSRTRGQAVATAVSTDTPFYLRYRSHVFKINWTPALIGRPIPGDSENRLLAVDLEPFSLAVSRRQAEIVMENGRFAIRCLNDNPILLNGSPLPFLPEATIQPVASLNNGDKILLQRSSIGLTCLQPESLQKQPDAAGGIS